ncbi:MAG: response regulator [Clostridia bacterium]|nr:response regulator [Clostridia bacterium]
MYNVIIVEDDPMVRMLNRTYIEENKAFHISGVFENGRDALEFLKKGNPVDLIVLDVFMPVMSGDIFLCELRGNGYSCGVILVTAVNEPEHFKKLMAFGITDYLVKPFEKARFMMALDKFIKSRQLVDKDTRLTQKELDSVYLTSYTETDSSLEKGLQEKTLEMVRGYLQSNTNKPLTSEVISDDIGLSRVTVRRYMNYLCEKGEIVSSVDYSTGGRPSITYIYKA